MTTTTRPTTPRKTAARPDDLSEVEALRADLELTRRHLADTVQELSRQLNVPRRIKDSATSAGHRAVQAAGSVKQRAGQRAKMTAGGMGERARATAGGMGERAKHLPEHAKNLPAKAKQAPELSRRHPKTTAAVGGAVALGVGAAAWIAGRNR